MYWNLYAAEIPKKNHVYYHYLSNIYIGNLCCDNIIVPPNQTAENVYNIFLRNDTLSGVTVVDSGILLWG